MKTVQKLRITTILATVFSTVAINSHAEALSMDCLIHPNKTVEISSPVTGVLQSISVDRSDSIRKGEVLAKLTSTVEQERFNAAKARVEFTGLVESSKASYELSQKEYQRAEALYEDRTIPLAEKERAEAQLAMARYEYDNAKHQHEVRKLELNEARANLELRQIKSPISGVVVDRYMSEGEFVDSSPVLKLAQLNPLRIELIAPVSMFGEITPGMHAKIQPEFGSYGELIAEVTVVDKVIDAASGTFGVRLSLDNKDMQVPSGLKCRLTMQKAPVKKPGLAAAK